VKSPTCCVRTRCISPPTVRCANGRMGAACDGLMGQRHVSVWMRVRKGRCDTHQRAPSTPECAACSPYTASDATPCTAREDGMRTDTTTVGAKPPKWSALIDVAASARSIVGACAAPRHRFTSSEDGSCDERVARAPRPLPSAACAQLCKPPSHHRQPQS
jgi:hypothetical protein